MKRLVSRAVGQGLTQESFTPVSDIASDRCVEFPASEPALACHLLHKFVRANTAGPPLASYSSHRANRQNSSWVSRTLSQRIHIQMPQILVERLRGLPFDANERQTNSSVAPCPVWAREAAHTTRTLSSGDENNARVRFNNGMSRCRDTFSAMSALNATGMNLGPGVFGCRHGDIRRSPGRPQPV